MSRLVRLLRELLPEGLNEIAVADLERELGLRAAGDGPRWRDSIWLLREALLLLGRVWIARGRKSLQRSAGELSADGWYAIRSLSRSPGLTLTAILVIALGVSAPTALYSVGDGLTRGLPVPDPEELVAVSHISGRWITERRRLNRTELELVRGLSLELDLVAAHETVMWDVGGGDQPPARVLGARVSHELSEVLRESPTVGRDFGPDDGGRPLVLMGERFWRTRFGSDPSILGRRLRLNGIAHTVIGILPAHLQFPSGAQLWVPLGSANDLSDPSVRRFGVLTRVPSGTALLERLQQALEGVELVGNEGGPQAHLSAARLINRLNIGSTSRRLFLGVLAMMTCLLLVAVFNVTNLLLCRAVSRSQDIAVRTALGASPKRVLTMHLVEAALISVAGGAVGVALAIEAVGLVRWGSIGRVGWWVDIRTDIPMLLFAVGLVVVAILLAGLVPAIQATRYDIRRGLHAAAHGGASFKLTWMSERLVVLQVMFSAALLVQAVVILATFLDPRAWSPAGSFETKEVLVAAYSFHPGERSVPGERFEFHRTLLDDVAKRGGIRSAGIMTPFPGGDGPEDWVVPAEYPRMPRYDRDRTLIVRMSPGALDVLGASVTRGRELTWDDGGDVPKAALVNEEYANRYYPDRDPLGEIVRFVPPGTDHPVEVAVVGVLPSLEGRRFGGDWPDAIYVPLTTGVLDEAQVLLRSARGRDPLSHVADLRAALDGLDTEKPLHSVGILRSLINRDIAMVLALGGIFVAAGLGGVLMSGAGLYAVMAFSVGRRTHEIGVRRALGASHGRVLVTVLGRAGVHLGQGVALGLVLALGMADRFLFAAWDPGVFGIVAAGLIVTGVVAATVPALRAVRVDPRVALQSE